MAKESFWFKHDYNARSDRRIMSLLMKTGVQGIGIYWCVVEMLYEEGGFLMHSECERIAFELRTDCESIKSVIESNLFRRDDEKFWSESVLRRLQERQDKSKKNSDNAIERWKKEREKKRMESENNANALQLQTERNANKKRGEESSLYLGYISNDVSNVKEEVEVKIEVKELSQKKEFNKKPSFNDVEDYPEIKKGELVQFFKIAKQVDITNEQIEAYWVAFKQQHLDGETFYNNEGKVHTHFFNWVTKKDLKNGQQPHYTSTTTQKSKSTKDDAAQRLYERTLNRLVQ